MQHPRVPLAIVALGASLLSACAAFGPPRTPPRMVTPSQYSVAPLTSHLAAGPVADQKLVVGAAPLPEWWHAFESEELDALVTEALAHNQSLAAAQANLRAAHEQVREQVGSNLYPHLDAGFAPSRQRELGIPSMPKQTFLYNVFAAELQTSWTLDFFGASVLADRALLGQVRAQAYQLEAARRSIAFNAVLAAINAASLQAQLDAIAQYAAAAEQRATQLHERFELGSASRLEMLAAEDEAAAAQRVLPTLHQRLLAVRHAQAVLLGRTPDAAPPPLPLEAIRLPERLPVTV
ncbi:MAG: TolC family protein, partial [Sinobacteraceae bacterium]|nr:TolC family protein [Nevskiaceae bacterium]